jgi:hypothetical protein
MSHALGVASATGTSLPVPRVATPETPRTCCAVGSTCGRSLNVEPEPSYSAGVTLSPVLSAVVLGTTPHSGFVGQPATGQRTLLYLRNATLLL